MTDQIDVAAAQIVRSPDVAGWAKTVRIASVSCSPDGGFVLSFDREIPESWKWPSNPAVPSDNFAYTVWFFLNRGNGWIGAGFVQMWKDRAMGVPGHAIPPIFNTPAGDSAPGWQNLWGDGARWPEMASFTPIAGENVAIMVSAGDARLRSGVSSVAERSNAVLFPISSGDFGGLIYDDTPGPVDPPIEPGTLPPALLAILANIETGIETIESGRVTDMGIIAQQLTSLQLGISQLKAQLSSIVIASTGGPAPIYDGQVTVPFLGTVKVTLTPRK